MDRAKVAAAFNEWMRQYVEEPEAFSSEWESIKEFLQNEANGQEPDYGVRCAALLEKLMGEA